MERKRYSKGFTLIEAIIAMVITLLMILVASSIIISVMQTFNSESEVIQVRDTIAVMESRFEGVFRDNVKNITIYEDESAVPSSGTCYFYNTGDKKMKTIVNGSAATDADGFPIGEGNNNEVSAVRFIKSAVVDNAINVEFYIQDEDDPLSSRLYQDLTLSSLNPHISISVIGTNDNNINLICFE